MVDTDIQRIRSEAERVCVQFGNESRVVDVMDYGKPTGMTVTFEFPRPTTQSNEEWQQNLRELRDQLQNIVGVDSVHLAISPS